MEVQQVTEDIHQFLVKNILSEGVSITPTTPLKSLGIDSYSIVEILLFIERKYGLIIPDNQLLPEHFESIHKTATLVSSLINND